VPDTEAVDLFAGPGGWEEGAALAGLPWRPLGLETDAHALNTRRAAGHRSWAEDVSQADPLPCSLLVASAPCPAWSQGGSARGQDREIVTAAARSLALGDDRRRELYPECTHRDAMLVVEPLRWALQSRPRWIAWEQVPGVLPFWELCAGLLAGHGYETWTGLLDAADYGVPQHRQRAVLMAHLGVPVEPPQPTHGPPPRPSPHRTMCQALDWGHVNLPAMTVVARTSGTGAPSPLDGGSGSRAVYEEARRTGQWRHRPGTAGLLVKRAGAQPVSDWEAMRCSPREAGVLQGFSAGYPWSGPPREQIRQAGNAIPPPLAAAILGALRIHA
jgi:DNA (cytosine-5)-methyltransferase 1